MLSVAGAIVIGLALLKDRRAAPGKDIAPQVSLLRLDGKQQAVESGTVTVIDFWATWCAPCRASMPRIQKVFHEYGPRGVALFSIDTDDEGPDRDPLVREFLMQNQLDFPVALDNGQRAAQNAFHVEAYPTMLVVGKSGRIVWRHVGAIGAGEERELRRVLDDALAAR